MSGETQKPHRLHWQPIVEGEVHVVAVSCPYLLADSGVPAVSDDAPCAVEDTDGQPVCQLVEWHDAIGSEAIHAPETVAPAPTPVRIVERTDDGPVVGPHPGSERNE